MNEMEEEKALKIIAEPKFYSKDLEFSERTNHKGIFIATAQPEERDGTIIPGLSINIEYKGAIVVDRCDYEIGLFFLDFKVKHTKRVYQLHVCPEDKRSHRTMEKDFFGPHEHVGRNVYEVRDPRVYCGNIEGAFKFFCERINLNFTGQLKVNNELRMD